MIYEINFQGESVPLRKFLEERNSKIFSVVDRKGEEIDVTSSTATGKKKMGSRLTTCLYAYFSKEPMMSRSNYVNLDVGDLNAYFSAYMEMLEHYNYYEPSNTKQLFSAYMGITTSKFDDLMDSADIDLKEKAIFINDVINGMIFAQAESSQNNASATLQRGRTKSVGQGHTIAQQDINLVVTPQSNPALLMQKAQQILADKRQELKSGK